MEKVTKEKRKRRCLKLWKAWGGRSTYYNTANQESKRAVHYARSEVVKVALKKIVLGLQISTSQASET